MTLPSAGRPARCAGSSHVPTKSEEYSHAHRDHSRRHQQPPQLHLSLGARLASLAPAQGPTHAGTTITLTGTNLTTTTGVNFGSAPASFTVASPTQITAVAPAGLAGPVTVTAVTPAGTSNGLSSTRTDAPAI
ncbi:IPT/TIG domain-containing protein [Streptomyces collinus]|uniref:IPT/TIG domain-containing protein n=1 Tax=Streptomyces collinus TaxID=42684 RepID=UPI0036A8348C